MILKASKLTEISVIQNTIFVDNLFEGFNLILSFCYTVSVFVNDQLNGMNIITSFLNFDGILKVGVNICIPNSNVHIGVSFDIENAIWFQCYYVISVLINILIGINWVFFFKSISMISIRFNWIDLNKSISMNNLLMNWFKSMFVKS